MTLVRVYCGLASADGPALAPEAQNWLTVSIVDDAGRLLDICEITDDPGGYAELCALFAQRGDGPAAVAVATANNDHAVTQLLTAAGRYMAYAGPDSADDFAERFADDGSPDEIRSGPAERRAIGLARALQAGVLQAVPQATPPEMFNLKPLLTAHAAIVTGRQQAAGTLREVLRELYPAALRAYADPAEPVSLAVLQALPEPSQLVNASAGRVQEGEVVAALVDAGVAEREILDEAVTALRVAIAETPRRAGVTRAMTSAVAETVKQAVASVRCFDGASEALVGVIADRMAPPVRPVEQPAYEAPRHLGAGFGAPQAPAQPPPLRVVSNGFGNGHSNGNGNGNSGLGETAPYQPEPVSPAPYQPAASFPGSGMIQVPAARPVDPGNNEERGQPTTELPRRPVPSSMPTAIPPSTRQSRPAFGSDNTSTFAGQSTFGSDNTSTFAGQPNRSFGSDNTSTFAGQPTYGSDNTSTFAGQPTYGSDNTSTFAGQPATGQFPAIPQPPAPFSQVTTDERFGAQPPAHHQPSPPMPRLSPEVHAPGSRGNWPLNGEPDEEASGSYPLVSGTGAADVPRQREGRVKPPWQSDDLPVEPPTLRLVEPAPLADPALSGNRPLNDPHDDRFDPPTLRLVPSASEQANRHTRVSASASVGVDHLGEAPVETNADDDDLLIFAACRSAWFIDGTEAEEEREWVTAADTGWEAASQAARPAVGAETTAGLPRRVPQRNLVPGSAAASATPEIEERPLRIVRDAAAIAAHTGAYFNGYRRGQEVGGFSVGGRPGRESSVGWDFSRDASGDEEFAAAPVNDYGYRSARR
ncbi:transposase [Virgisporangium aurantiacum]|uniref:Transposase n=1 Tax=Virgisporangium aurantiacum TaxID=175570 RepID=A0A8J3Z1E4_9ACTN|nr:transposase [Virgisporangium aurantiacum]GIJ53565.1 hypothetical protein Vau01_010810 [Virgisporangium aurantiacum]